MAKLWQYKWWTQLFFWLISWFINFHLSSFPFYIYWLHSNFWNRYLKMRNSIEIGNLKFFQLKKIVLKTQNNSRHWSFNNWMMYIDSISTSQCIWTSKLKMSIKLSSCDQCHIPEKDEKALQSNGKSNHITVTTKLKKVKIMLMNKMHLTLFIKMRNWPS